MGIEIGGLLGLIILIVDAWEDIKEGISDAYIYLSDALEKAEIEFDSSESGKKSK